MIYLLYHDALMQEVKMRIPVIIPDEHHEELRKLAFVKKSSMAEEIRKAIAEYLEKEREGK